MWTSGGPTFRCSGLACNGKPAAQLLATRPFTVPLAAADAAAATARSPTSAQPRKEAMTRRWAGKSRGSPKEGNHKTCEVG